MGRSLGGVDAGLRVASLKRRENQVTLQVVWRNRPAATCRCSRSWRRLMKSWASISRGYVRRRRATWPGALDSYRKALAIREALAAAYPTNPQARRDLAGALNRIGDALPEEPRGIECRTFGARPNLGCLLFPRPHGQGYYLPALRAWSQTFDLCGWKSGSKSSHPAVHVECKSAAFA